MGISFKCALMDRYFLYLPLLYAESEEYFGLLPPGYSLKTEVISGGATDASILKKILNVCVDRDRPFAFGVCDPMSVFEVSERHAEPAILCALVANATFWAVDRDAGIIRGYQDIGKYYAKVISYQPGTTSHAIARRIQKSTTAPLIVISFIPSF